MVETRDPLSWVWKAVHVEANIENKTTENNSVEQ